jgi:tetratricopeptide (TPR) repeat protein
MRSLEYRAAAYVEIAGLRLLQKDYKNAEVYARKALDYNRFNIPAYQSLGIAYRKQNKLAEAEKNLESLAAIDPLNHFIRFEQTLLEPGSESLSAFTSAIRNEFPHETYLELAVEYANRGLTREAIQVLEHSPPSPVAYYWLAYLSRSGHPEKSKQYLLQAEEMSPRMVFPFRLETIPVLDWAREQHPSWKNSYYLGLIYWNIRRMDKARKMFDTCENEPDFATFYMARGLLYQNNSFGDDAAGEDFRRAHQLDPAGWRTGYYLAGHYRNTGAFEKELAISEQIYSRFPDHPVVGISHAKSLLYSNKNQECLEVLARTHVLPQEFANEGHGIFERASLTLAMDHLEKNKYKKALKYVDISREWPENLGSGKPYEPDNRLQDYIAAYCEEQLGNPGSAEQYYRQIVEFSRKQGSDSRDPTSIYIASRVLASRGNQGESAALMKEWEAKQDSLRDWRISGGSSSPQVQWVLAKYKQQEEKAGELEARLLSRPYDNSRFGIFHRACRLIDRKPE